MLRNVKPPRNLKGSCTTLGDLGCEFGLVVRLEGGRHSKPWEDFSTNKLSHSRGSFVSSRESFIPSRKCIYKDWEKFNPFYRWQVGEIAASLVREDVSEFGGWGKEGGEC